MNKTVLFLYLFFFCIGIWVYFAIYVKYREVFIFSLFLNLEINRPFPVNGKGISFFQRLILFLYNLNTYELSYTETLTKQMP